MYRTHPNHTYGRNRNNSANNWAFVIEYKYWNELFILVQSTTCTYIDQHRVSRNCLWHKILLLSKLLSTNRCKAENPIKINGNFIIKGVSYCLHFSFTFYVLIL
jgi:hypothetical protein